MYVVAGVSGHTGKVVAETLLAQALPVRVMVRNAAKGEPWKAKGAEVVVADVHDAKAMTAALKGATGAYLLNPPNWGATDIMKNAAEVAQAMKTAITESRVGHVVLLSSIAAQHERGTGPIASMHHIEKVLSDCPTHITYLRAGYFMENLLSNMKPMTEQGVLPALFDAGRAVEMIATADIGAVAAELLRAGKSAPKVVELSGPAARSFTDVASLFSSALKKPVSVAVVPPAAQVDALKGAGLPEVWAKAYAEMGQAMQDSRVVFQGTPRRGLISLEQFVSRAMQA